MRDHIAPVLLSLLRWSRVGRACANVLLYFSKFTIHLRNVPTQQGGVICSHHVLADGGRSVVQELVTAQSAVLLEHKQRLHNSSMVQEYTHVITQCISILQQSMAVAVIAML